MEGTGLIHSKRQSKGKGESTMETSKVLEARDLSLRSSLADGKLTAGSRVETHEFA
jgi:hypothetical protein